MLLLSEHWVWDFWHVHDGEKHHLFFLKALRSLLDPDLRHFSQSIGHATSSDLRTWDVLPDALAPSDGEGWDNGTTWTGSVIRHDAKWWMFYTGTNKSERSLVQRVGAATSQDLVTWTRVGDHALVEANPKWYELLDEKLWHDQAWRDPFVFELDGSFHMFLTARTNSGPTFDRGVIGHATSPDLLHWTVQAPLSEPGDFGQLEVPQVVWHSGQSLLLFCSSGDMASKNFLKRHRGPLSTGTFTMSGAGPLGPFTFVDAPPIAASAETGDGPYAGKIVWHEARPYFLGFLNNDRNGEFIGAISDPIPVSLDGSRVYTADEKSP